MGRLAWLVWSNWNHHLKWSNETIHLPLPEAHTITCFSLAAKCWLRGGVGGQFPRNLNWSVKLMQSRIPDCLSVELGFLRIPFLSRISGPWAESGFQGPGFGFHKQKFPWFRNPDCLIWGDKTLSPRSNLTVRTMVRTCWHSDHTHKPAQEKIVFKSECSTKLR